MKLQFTMHVVFFTQDYVEAIPSFRRRWYWHPSGGGRIFLLDTKEINKDFTTSYVKYKLKKL